MAYTWNITICIYMCVCLYTCVCVCVCVSEKAMAPHSSTLAWKIPGTGELVGCCLWGHTESDTTEAT